MEDLEEYHKKYHETKKVLKKHFPYQVGIRCFAEMYPPISSTDEYAVLFPIAQWMEEKLGPSFKSLGLVLLDPSRLDSYLTTNKDKVWVYFTYCFFLRNRNDALLVKLHWG